ncbi:hypothetical protein ACFQX6_55475 [Streptosporangium lutulentum]
MLILSASMGAGHDVIATELVRRLAAEGVEAEVVDILDLLPLRLGVALRGWYGWMVRSAPWLYALIYRVFFVSDRAPSVSPLTIVVAARLRRLIRSRQVTEVVSTFHMAAQAAGHLRRYGRLPVPSTVLLTDFAAHRLWLHPGNDRYLCPDLATAHAVHTATGCPVSCHAPVVRLGFRRSENGAASTRSRIGARADDRLVLVSAARGVWATSRRRPASWRARDSTCPSSSAGTIVSCAAACGMSACPSTGATTCRG